MAASEKAHFRWALPILAAEQVAGGTHVARIDVSHREHAAAQQGGDFEGVDPVVLHFAAVDGFHVQGVAEHEGDALVLAQISEPVPGEHALGADDKAIAIRCNSFQKRLGASCNVAVQHGLAAGVKDA